MRAKTVIFVAPRLLKSSELPQDILFRFNMQASLARDLNADVNISFLFFFTATNKSLGLNFSRFPHLQIFKSFDFGAFPIFMLFNLVRKTWRIRESDIMLVTGDISVGLPVSILISRYFLPNSRIQLAIHGDPFSSRNNSLKRHIQVFLFKHFISSVDSFRVVSPHLELFLSKYLGRSKATTVVSPIPIQMTSEIEVARVRHTVGFVGRLHSERGVEEWCSIIQALEKERTTSLLVLGNGPLASYMKSQIPEITFFGSLPRQEVLKSYSQVSVLLSCAANEGYGLAIREAVLHGTFVVAKRNPGTSLLEETFPEAVALYTTKEEAVELLIAARDKKLSNEQVLTFRKIQKDLDEQSSVKLVNSWIS